MEYLPTATPLQLLFLLLLCGTVYMAARLLVHIRIAQRIGLPYTVYPWSAESGWVWLLYRSRAVQVLLPRLPPRMADYLSESCVPGRWRVHYRGAARAAPDYLYLQVSPKNVLLCVADPAAAHEALTETERFGKRLSQYEILKMYGRNIVASDGHEWQYYRKHIWPVFNERANSLVWAESLSQAGELLRKWEQPPSITITSSTPLSSPTTATRPTTTTSNATRTTGSKDLYAAAPNEDLMSLALHVYAQVALGVHISFHDPPPASSSLPLSPPPATSTSIRNSSSNGNNAEDEEDMLARQTAPPGFAFSFPAALRFIYFNMVLHAATRALPTWLPSAVLPAWVAQHRRLSADFSRYLGILVKSARREAKAVQKTPGTRDTLLSMMAASQNTVEKGVEDERDGKRRGGLSDSEITGNLFTIGLAGHETTARTLNFAFVCLALYQETQAWLQQCIDGVLRDQPEDPALWRYEDVFPKLTAPLCLMMETLRLYNAVPGNPLQTRIPTTITSASSGQTYSLPASLGVEVMAANIPYSPTAWGPSPSSSHSPFTFDPQRWDRSSSTSFLARNASKSGLAAPGLESSALHRPSPRGAFVPFGDGLRACVGRRFAMAEFVAVITRVCRYYDVGLAVAEGHAGETRERAEKVLADSEANLTLTVREPIPLVFTPRIVRG